MNKILFDTLSQGSNVVTPTRQLAQRILDAYALQQYDQGSLSWPTPAIYSWFTWCQKMWDELIFSDPALPHLLSNYESLLLWQQVIEASAHSDNILHTRSTARQAQSAYALYRTWEINNVSEELFLPVDAFAFQQWKKNYEQLLNKHRWVDSAQLPSLISSEINKLEQLQNPIVFYAFDEWTPQHSTLMDALESNGVECMRQQAQDINEAFSIIPFSDTRAEIEGMADWIIHVHDQDPTARIGIVVADIKTQRESLMHSLEQVLAVNNYFVSPGSGDLPFAISVGKPLEQYALVNSALCLLSLNYYRLDVNQLSTLLRSPFLGGYQQEKSQRCRLHRLLMKKGHQFISFADLESWHEALDVDAQAPGFLSVLKEIHKLIQEGTKKQPATKWLPLINDCLQAAGWPGDRTLNSAEYQITTAWHDILSQLSSIDSTRPQMTFTEFRNHLFWLCSQQNFQPQTATTGIEIIGIDAASGMQFDKLWLFGVHDQAWPQPYSPNPFIPIAIQQEHAIPTATANGRLQQSERIFSTLVHSAKTVTASYPLSDGEQVFRPSPLLSNLDSSVAQAYPLTKKYVQQPDKIATEHIEDQYGKPLAKGQVVSGGASLFQDQAACPQRAYVNHRLLTESIPELDVGISALEKGNLVHRALQLFWQSVKHSNHLQRMTSEVLDQELMRVVKQACEECIQRPDKSVNDVLQGLESQRLKTLLHNFVAVELKREPFTVIATEKGHHAMVSDIVVHLRIDRIDQLADGSLVIIDYKTGQTTSNAWIGERPDDPQLPLYAITADESIAAILIARIRTGDTRYLGNTVTSLGNIKIDQFEQDEWQQKLVEWKQVISQLAVDFRAAKASVDPMVNACKHCDLSMLCRIHERVLTLEDMDI